MCMMKVMHFSSHVRTCHVSGWLSIILFASAVSIAVCQRVKVQTISHVAARCGENVTLTCDAVSSGQMDVMSFSWLARNKSVCQYRDGQPDPEVLCEVTGQRLTLTIPNVMPVDQGTYLCKLRSNLGAPSNKTVLTVQDCLESNGSFINKSHAGCWFSGVYPNGTVDWFQGDIKFTDFGSTQEEMDQHGRYNLSSIIDVHKGNLSQPYTCSLWTPFVRKQLSLIRSSGSLVELQWVCVMVEIIMVTFMT